MVLSTLWYQKIKGNFYSSCVGAIKIPELDETHKNFKEHVQKTKQLDLFGVFMKVTGYFHGTINTFIKKKKKKHQEKCDSLHV